MEQDERLSVQIEDVEMMLMMLMAGSVDVNVVVLYMF